MIKTPSKTRPAKSTIARGFILYIVLFSSFITLISTAVQLYRDYNTDLDQIQLELKQIEGVHLDSLSAALWASNRALLQTSLDGILKMRDMQYIEIREDEKIWASSGNNIAKDTLRRHYSIEYRHRNKDLTIGSLTVVVSLQGVYQRLIDKVWVILVSNGIKTFLVSIFIYFLFIKLVAKHLSKISQFAETNNPLSKEQPLTLDRTSKKRDEFNIVVESINDMHDRLHEQIAEVDRQKQYLAQTLNSIGDAVIATDIDGNVTRMNPVAENLTGWSLQEAQGQSLKSIFPIIDASTREVIENPVDKVISTGETVYLSNHTRLISKDGSEFQIADSAAPIRDAENILGMVLVFNDVTEQYQLRETAIKTKQRLTDAQRMTHLGNWEHDLPTHKLEWSEEIYRIFEIDANKFSGSYEAFLNAIYAEDRERVKTAFAESVENRTPYKVEYRLRMADGRIKHVHERCETFYDDKGKPILSVGTTQDITERVTMEENLRRSQKMDAVGQLSGGIAHDFNNQLGVVIGYLDFLKEQFPLEAKPRKWVDTAIRATLRCTDLTRQLLSFSRRQATEKNLLNLNAMISEMDTMISRSITPEVEVQTLLADDLWRTETNAGEFQDALLNMILNARDAMPGGGKLIIETTNKHLDADFAALNPGLEAGDYIELILSDTGTGMDKATLDHIFEPYFTTKPDGKGTGLGMAMVYGFTKRYEGYIKIYSEPGVGTTMRLYLPRAVAESSTSEVNNQENAMPTGHETILIVDDEVDLLELAEHYLSDLGYRTLTAENAAQALTILGDEPIDLLFSDVVMPGGMNGYELAQQATQQSPNLKVLITSGFTSKSITQNGLARFATNLLSKPYRKAGLAQSIRRVLDD